MASIDGVDREILRLLQADARVTREEIAQKLKTSKSTVQYRIRKLESLGIIEGYYAKINPAKLGKDYQAITLLRAKFSPLYYERLGERLASLPGVWAVYFTLGDYDFVLLTRGVGREDLLNSIENLTQIKGVERTVTQLVVKTVKEDPRLEI
jgi:Lrp/AsnC family leucine-responsive transcriptional regulator